MLLTCGTCAHGRNDTADYLDLQYVETVKRHNYQPQSLRINLNAFKTTHFTIRLSFQFKY